jgi:hypothetical protein
MISGLTATRSTPSAFRRRHLPDTWARTGRPRLRLRRSLSDRGVVLARRSGWRCQPGGSSMAERDSWAVRNAGGRPERRGADAGGAGDARGGREELRGGHAGAAEKHRADTSGAGKALGGRGELLGERAGVAGRVATEPGRLWVSVGSQLVTTAAGQARSFALAVVNSSFVRPPVACSSTSRASCAVRSESGTLSPVAMVASAAASRSATLFRRSPTARVTPVNNSVAPATKRTTVMVERGGSLCGAQRMPPPMKSATPRSISPSAESR